MSTLSHRSATEASGGPDAPSLLVRAATGHPGPYPPVWFMRQAGRSLPEYRELRVGTSMLEACRTPELITEITLQPVRRHDVDAAIFFSDIVVPLVAIGVGIDIVPASGRSSRRPFARSPTCSDCGRSRTATCPTSPRRCAPWCASWQARR